MICDITARLLFPNAQLPLNVQHDLLFHSRFIDSECDRGPSDMHILINTEPGESERDTQWEIDRERERERR